MLDEVEIRIQVFSNNEECQIGFGRCSDFLVFDLLLVEAVPYGLVEIIPTDEALPVYVNVSIASDVQNRFADRRIWPIFGCFTHS